jgi:hypothetical protein
MKIRPAACVLLAAALPAFAQGVERHLYLDAYHYAPSLSGHLTDTSPGSPIDVDLQNDLGLQKDKTKPGFGLEYQGPRFGIELSRDEEDYKGQSVLTRSITVNGQTYTAATQVTSTLKAVNNTFNWTIRPLSLDHFWLGIDLGARVTQVKVEVTGDVSGQPVTSSYSTPLPVPQVGPSLGFVAADGRVVARGYYHLLAYKGASYHHAGADLRLFPLSWLGVMVFADTEHFRVPQGSIKSDLDATLDRSGTGVGVVVRF